MESRLADRFNGTFATSLCLFILHQSVAGALISINAEIAPIAYKFGGRRRIS
jgi:hypothetical protein